MASAASVRAGVIKPQALPFPTSLPGLCLGAISKHNKEDALNQKIGATWVHIPASAFAQRVRHVALGLAALGVRPGDRIALLSENRPEWSIADLAILSLGAMNVPIYTTQAVEQIGFVLADSGARIIFISNRKLYRHARTALVEAKGVERIIFFEMEAAEDLEK